MSSIREEGIGYGGTDKDYPSPNAPTDTIISHYESLMSRNIAIKTVAAAKTGESPNFTKEEMAYLVKKTDTDSSEVKVIAPAPVITLKKGNTEIKIKNAADLVKKMEDLYPKGMSSDSADNINRQPYVKASIEHGLKDLEEKELHYTPSKNMEIKTTNKNAYEIRLEVLKEAMTFLNWTTECTRTDKNPYPHVPTSDDAIELAQKFYKFVENRR